MRVVEFQLSANFLAYSQPSVNLNKTQLTLWIKFTPFFLTFLIIVKGFCETTSCLQLVNAQPLRQCFDVIYHQ